MRQTKKIKDKEFISLNFSIAIAIFLITTCLNIQIALAEEKSLSLHNDNGNLSEKFNQNAIILGGHLSTWLLPIGKYRLSSPDQSALGSELKGLSIFFIEWISEYMFGFGLKSFGAQTDAFFPSMSAEENEKDIVSNFFLHIAFYTDLEKNYDINIGFLYGYSPSSSFSRWRLTPEGEQKKAENKENLTEDDFSKEETKGTASILECYAEYYFGDHGFRLSFFKIESNFKKFKDNTKPDGSGYGYYLSYRYAFSL